MNPPRLVLIQTAVTPADSSSCKVGGTGEPCTWLEFKEAGPVCVALHRKLRTQHNPYRVIRLDICKRAEERNRELCP